MPPEAVKGFLLLIGISQFSASNIFHPDRLCRWPCLVKGDARVLAHKVSSHLDFLEEFYLSLVAYL
jgi:hypothetical protein